MPRVLPAEMATDPLLCRRLRLPVRLCGGALRERGGWLCDVAYVAQLLRVLPAMTDHAPEAGAGEEPIPGFAHDLLEPLLGGDLAAGMRLVGATTATSRTPSAQRSSTSARTR